MPSRPIPVLCLPPSRVDPKVLGLNVLIYHSQPGGSWTTMRSPPIRWWSQRGGDDTVVVLLWSRSSQVPEKNLNRNDLTCSETADLLLGNWCNGVWLIQCVSIMMNGRRRWCFHTTVVDGVATNRRRSTVLRIVIHLRVVSRAGGQSLTPIGYSSSQSSRALPEAI